MALLYTNGGKNQYLYYKNIAQKSAADFMQIDEMDIGIKIPASYDGQPGKCYIISNHSANGAL